MTMLNNIIIGTRKSKLAIAQSNFVKNLIKELCPDLNVELKPIVTKGDQILDKPLSEIGDKGHFTEELEKELLSEEIDIAVHSLKDLPTELPDNLDISSYSKRECPNDCFVSIKYNLLKELPTGSTVGTSSLRRKSQLLNLRPDLNIVDLRGNVETRLTKLENENMDAIVIATAGLIRLELKNRITEILPLNTILPAVGQGIIAIESKKNRTDLNELLAKINNSESESMAKAERAVLRTFGGGCRVPIGAFASLDRDDIFIEAYIGSVDGKNTIKQSIKGSRNEACELGNKLAQRMLDLGANNLISEIRNETI